MLETMILSIPGVAYLIYLAIVGEGHFLTHSLTTDLFLVISGFLTMLPLYLFSEGARRIPLASVGFLQYIAPTFMLLIGVVLYNEPLTRTYQVSFLLIWTGLAIYTYNLFRTRYRNKKRSKRR
jgi:chloramphenicol-sensitive protein RarD